MDQRVRFLQGARMKLSRLIFPYSLKENEEKINLPWKMSNNLEGSRHSNSSSKKSFTPRKVTPRKINNKN